VPIIRANVEQLGFKFTDIRILLGSHAHSDHVEGTALVKELTGAAVYVMQGDDEVIARGGEGQYLYNARWKPCRVDRVLKDGDQVTLGEASLTAHLTPGHTRGCTTWTLTVQDGGRSYLAVIVGSPNVNPGYRLAGNADYPEIADFARTFRVLKGLRCDIFLGAHGNYYNMEAKFARLQAGERANPFVDPAGYRAYIEEREKYFLETLAKQKSERP
jgi:metallo-beta-lactamase class B